MCRKNVQARIREAWRSWGVTTCVALAYFWAAHQLLAAADASERVHALLREFEPFDLDEILLLAAMAFPVACVALCIQAGRLRRETLRRRALDELMTELFYRLSQSNAERQSEGALAESPQNISSTGRLWS